MSPPIPLPLDLAIEAAVTARDDWDESNADPEYAPAKAMALLAAWGRLSRLFTPTELPSEVADLQAFIQEEAPRLLAAFARIAVPADRLERARHIDQALDFATEEEALRELEIR